ncbi:MAG: hypothetical protein ACRDJE_18120 [Dehalococcoidia bacterium]
MTRDRTPAITDAEIRSLAAKLKGLHALLTPPEQALLRTVLSRAAQRDETAPSDAEGFVWGVSFNPFTFLDAIARDFQAERDARDR